MAENSYNERTLKEKIAHGKEIDDQEKKRAVQLLETAHFVAGNAIIELNESHFYQHLPVVVRARTIPCLVELLTHIRSKCYYLPGWYPEPGREAAVNRVKIEEIDGIIASLNDIFTNPQLENGTIPVLDRIMKLKV